jgi:glycosyltransferase involved in cell wall biosynthesis
MARGDAYRYVNDLLACLPAAGHAALVPITSGGRLRPWRAPFTPWGLRAVARETVRAGADLLHGLHLELAPVDIPAVVTIHDVIPLEFPASMPSRARREVYRRTLDSVLARARRVLVPSEATARALERHGADPARLRVVALGTGAQFRPATGTDRDDARRRFASGRPYVVAMTGPRPHKNLTGVVAAARRLSAPPELAVVAPGPPSPLHAGPVRFVGRLDDAELSLLYGGAEATLVASHVEGFGLPVLESLACGTPVVCGPGVGSLPWLDAGVLVVDVGRPAEIAEALARLASDAVLRKALGGAGRAAAAVLTREAMAASTFAVYREVLTEATSAARR